MSPGEHRDALRRELAVLLTGFHLKWSWREWSLRVHTQVGSTGLEEPPSGKPLLELLFSWSPEGDEVSVSWPRVPSLRGVVGPLVFARDGATWDPEDALPIVEEILRLVLLASPTPRMVGSSPGCCAKSEGVVRWSTRGWPPAGWGWALDEYTIDYCPFCGRPLT